MLSWPNVARVRYNSQTFLRPCSMTFSVEYDHTPADRELGSLVQALIDWDQNFSPTIGGYVLTRSTASQFVSVDVWTISNPRRAFLIPIPTLQPGIIPPHVSNALPTTLTPRVEWETDGHQMKSPRTYAVGQVEQYLLSGPDLMEVNNDGKTLLTAAFNDLRSRFNALAGATMVGLKTRSIGGVQTVVAAVPLLSANCERQFFGSQRRRTLIKTY